MFLKELLKLTSHDHPDYNQLQEAFHAVTDMATSINGVCIKVGYMQKITDIAKATGMVVKNSFWVILYIVFFLIYFF